MARISTAGACIALAGILLLGGSAHAATPEQKCQEAKLRAQGKLQLCLQKNSAKVVAGRPDASAACQMKFQAALTKAGTACRYLDNGDGTVSDLNTGLQWEKKDNLDGIVNDADPHDADNTYAWSASGSAADGTVYTDFLSKLNSGSSTDGGASTAITGCFAGHCDWRLPSIVELQDIVEVTQGYCASGSGACINSAFGPTPANFYWSATTRDSGPTNAWDVTFGAGSVGSTNKNGSLEGYDGYVRAVRGGF